MKNLFKLLGIIALIAVIGFSMVACDFSSGDEDESGNGDGNDGGGNTLKIVNNTSNQVMYCSIKPSYSTEWVTVFSLSPLSSGQSRTVTIPISISANSKYDIRLDQAFLGTYIKYGISISSGMTLTFTESDSNDESNLPKIITQNRSGVGFSSCYIKPSSAPEWGRDFGSLSNNSDETITIPIPLSNYTIFDIQMRRTGTGATYTKNSITVSNGMTVTILSTDSDSPNNDLPVIVIQNNTSSQIMYCSVKPTNSTDWISVFSLSPLSSGRSRTITLPQSLSENSIYDIRLDQAFLGTYIKYDISISDGMTLTFTDNDSE